MTLICENFGELDPANAQWIAQTEAGSKSAVKVLINKDPQHRTDRIPMKCQLFTLTPGMAETVERGGLAAEVCVLCTHLQTP